MEDYLKQHGITLETAKRFGLFQEGRKVIIPIRDKNGKELFKKERWLDYKIDPQITKKFTYDPIGSKSTLFNTEVLKNNETILLVEGEPDCIRLSQEGIPAVTGTSGAATFKKEWVDELKDKKIIVCYDNDEEGKKGLKKVLSLLKAQVLILPPKYKDISEFLLENSVDDLRDLPLQDGEYFYKTSFKTKEKTKEQIKEDEKNRIYTSYFETPEYILEQIKNATDATDATLLLKSRFIIYDKNLGTTDIKDSFEYQGKTYYPIESKLVDQDIVGLPTNIEEYKSTDELVKEIKKFLDTYFEVPKLFEPLLPFVVMFYWIYDKFPFIPYIQFLGRTGTGKTTAMEVLGSICYKPINSSGAITMAAIFRIASMWHGTLMIDEFNPGGDTYSEMLSLLKSGVSDTAVLRVEGEKKKEVEAYMVKSPKIFTSENPVNDPGFRSRIIEVRMDTNQREVPLYRDKSFKKEAIHLRNKLLLWRLHNLSTIDISSFPKGFPELRSFQGRVQQVLTPIYYLAGDEARREIVKFAKEQEEETTRERREAVDGQIFEILLENNKNKIPTSLIDLTEKLNKNLSRPMSERRIANIIRKIIGFSIERIGHENVRTIILDNKEKEIIKLCKYYGLDSPSKVAQVAQVAKVEQSISNDEIFPF